MTCIHHWLVAPPTAPTSEAVCKLCGAQKTLSNYYIGELVSPRELSKLYAVAAKKQRRPSWGTQPLEPRKFRVSPLT